MQKQTKAGFTLIELLVVVLIIGILAAIALPQYKKAVLKSEYSKFKPLVKAIANAEELHYLATGSYTTDSTMLDIEWPETPSNITGNTTAKNYYFNWGYCSIKLSIGDERVVCYNKNEDMSYRIILQYGSSTFAGMQGCTAPATNATIVQICQQESGLSEPQEPGNTQTYYWK